MCTLKLQSISLQQPAYSIGLKKAPYGFLTARDLGANIARVFRVSTCKTNMEARYDRTIVI